MKLARKDAADKVADVASGVTDRAGRVASGVEDIAGDVADKAAGGAKWIVRVLKPIAKVVLFPLLFILLLFGCGPLS